MKIHNLFPSNSRINPSILFRADENIQKPSKYPIPSNRTFSIHECEMFHRKWKEIRVKKKIDAIEIVKYRRKDIKNALRANF